MIKTIDMEVWLKLYCVMLPLSHSNLDAAIKADRAYEQYNERLDKGLHQESNIHTIEDEFPGARARVADSLLPSTVREKEGQVFVPPTLPPEKEK